MLNLRGWVNVSGVTRWELACDFSTIMMIITLPLLNSRDHEALKETRRLRKQVNRYAKVSMLLPVTQSLRVVMQISPRQAERGKVRSAGRNDAGGRQWVEPNHKRLSHAKDAACPSLAMT